MGTLRRSLKGDHEIHLVGRLFDPVSGGHGRICEDFRKLLSEESNYRITVSEAWGKSRLAYLLYAFGTLGLTLPRNADLYHALTSMETFFLPPEKTVVTVHDLIPVNDAGSDEYSGTSIGIGPAAFMGRVLFYATLMKAARCARIVCVSEETKKELLQLTNCGGNKVRVTPWGIQDKYHYIPPKPGKKLVIGTLSVHKKRKRIDWLIRQFMKLMDDDLELRIGGHGPMLPELKRIAKRDKRVRFYGYIPEEEMLDFYAGLDIFVFPSAHEGFGLPIVEAARVGRPVITLKNAMIPEIVAGRTLTIDEDGLGEAINSLNERGERELIGKELSKWSERFRQRDSIRDYLAIYEELLSSRKSQ